MAKSSKNKQKKIQHAPRKIRGTWLTIALVAIVLHGLLAAVYYAAAKVDSAYMARPWLISLMVLHFLANVLAAIGIWYWKKWGVYIYCFNDFSCNRRPHHHWSRYGFGILHGITPGHIRLVTAHQVELF